MKYNGPNVLSSNKRLERINCRQILILILSTWVTRLTELYIYFNHSEKKYWIIQVNTNISEDDASEEGYILGMSDNWILRKEFQSNILNELQFVIANPDEVTAKY